ncbi:hypothetical protein FA13DRAFT_230679 [Coprinellus micaceus]|uniref:Uncharacterized protein n=1 Tax=Coprinellus micaceus TaxID=71717 RepID=A0A4Y7TH29_COPMI|nr:hypothetical protein FA13DRAFT_230679 [Coprinellus micaceus]
MLSQCTVEKIHGLNPLFKLLPWYETLSESDQVPDGTSEPDWDRFSLYALAFASSLYYAGMKSSHRCGFEDWVIYPPRDACPDVPKLRSASISSIDLMSSKTLLLFVSPTLVEFRFDCDAVPQECEPPGLSPTLRFKRSRQLHGTYKYFTTRGRSWTNPSSQA